MCHKSTIKVPQRYHGEPTTGLSSALPVCLRACVNHHTKGTKPPCEATGTEPRYETWAGEPGSEVAYVVSLNLARRHLNESQRSMVADRLARLPSHRPGSAQICALNTMTQEEAAQALNVSRRNVQHARTVNTHGTPELIDAVDRGEIAVSQAASLARAPKETQREVVDKVKAGAKAPGRPVRLDNGPSLL